MQRATVELSRGDGTVATLRPGDLIGRLVGAALRINDPRISEVHAYVSLRGAELVLIALRGGLTVDGIQVTEVALEPGLTLGLCPQLTITVGAVRVPESLLGVGVDGRAPEPLSGEPRSLMPDGSLSVGLHAGAVARLWSDGAADFLEEQGTTRTITAGDAVQLGGHALRFVALPVAQAAVEHTAGKAAFPPLLLTLQHDAARLCHLGGTPLALSGLGARLLSELHAMGGSAHWDVVSGELWPEEPDRHVRRTRWDKALSALRRRMEAADIRPDLVSTSAGMVQLVLLPGDSVQTGPAAC